MREEKDHVREIERDNVAGVGAEIEAGAEIGKSEEEIEVMREDLTETRNAEEIETERGRMMTETEDTRREEERK